MAASPGSWFAARKSLAIGYQKSARLLQIRERLAADECVAWSAQAQPLPGHAPLFEVPSTVGLTALQQTFDGTVRNVGSNVERHHVDWTGHALTCHAEGGERIQHSLLVTPQRSVASGDDPNHDTVSPLYDPDEPQHPRVVGLCFDHIVGGNAANEPWGVVETEASRPYWLRSQTL